MFCRMSVIGLCIKVKAYWWLQEQFIADHDFQTISTDVCVFHLTPASHNEYHTLRIF